MTHLTASDFASIGKDLATCDLIAAYGNLVPRNVRQQAKRHRRALMDAVKAANAADGLDSITDDELMAELAA